MYYNGLAHQRTFPVSFGFPTYLQSKVHFRQYFTLDWRDFPENSNLRHIVAVSQNSKGTVLEDYSTFSTVSQFTLEVRGSYRKS